MDTVRSSQPPRCCDDDDDDEEKEQAPPLDNFKQVQEYHHEPLSNKSPWAQPPLSSFPENNYSSQTATSQTEILTQNPDLTQMGDEDDHLRMEEWEEPWSPHSHRNRPWGRLLPCSAPSSTIQPPPPRENLSPPPGPPKTFQPFQGGAASSRISVDLLPRSPLNRQKNNENAGESIHGPGLEPPAPKILQPFEIFNEYSLGRASKCDVMVTKPPRTGNVVIDSLHDWTFGMISNRHCRIYCCLKDDNLLAGTDHHNTTLSATAQGLVTVYLEDDSNNGTLINQTTLLRRGEKRQLHSGDEICLVNPAVLRKKIKSATRAQDILHSYSYLFVNLVQNHQPTVLPRPWTHSAPSPLGPSCDPIPAPPELIMASGQKKAAAVDVRAIKSHSWARPAPPCQVRTGAGCSQETVESNRRPSPSAQRRTSPRRRPRFEEDYDLRDLLGSGTMGEVRRAIHRKTGEERAVKILALGGRNRLTLLVEETQATLQAEASILQGLDHPYVVRLIDVYTSPTALYLVMELMPGGDLFDRIVAKGRYSEVDSRRVVRRLLCAVHYLHQRDIVHRDLKPENILCVNRQSDIDVKLTDFGLAKNANEGLKTFCGTPQYFAPEVLRRRTTVKGRGRYGKPADMWSLGVMVYILLSGTPPFDVDGGGLEAVLDAVIPFDAPTWQGISEQAQDFVRQLLVADPRRRMTVVQACQHAWIQTEDGDTHVHPLEDPVWVAWRKTPPQCSNSVVLPENQGSKAHSPSALSPDPTIPKSEPVAASLAANSSNPIKSACPAENSVPPPSPPAELWNRASVPSKADSIQRVARAMVSKPESNLEIAVDHPCAAGLLGTGTLTSPRPSDHMGPLSPLSLNIALEPRVRNETKGAQKKATGPGPDAIPCENRVSATKLGTSPGSGESIGANHSSPSFSGPRHGFQLRTNDRTMFANSVTPSASNKRTACVPTSSEPLPTSSSGLELTDDEILSSFSEKTDSIMSFSTTGEMANEILNAARGFEDTCRVPTGAIETPGKVQASTKSRKRRVTDSVGDQEMSLVSEEIDKSAKGRSRRTSRKQMPATTAGHKAAGKAVTSNLPSGRYRKSSEGKQRPSTSTVRGRAKRQRFCVEKHLPQQEDLVESSGKLGQGSSKQASKQIQTTLNWFTKKQEANA